MDRSFNSLDIKTNENNNKTGRTLDQIRQELRHVDHNDIRCGCGNWNPPQLQWFASKQTYLVLYSLVGVFLGSFFTYMVSVISTIEKRFALNSKQTGVMLAGNDVSQILLSMVVSYFGNYGNRPKWMAVGIISAAVSCFVAVTPHLLYPGGDDLLELDSAYTSGLNDSSSDLCGYTPPEESPAAAPSAVDARTSAMTVFIFFISQFCLGLSVSTFYSLGLVYLDDNVNKNETPLYYGLSMLVRVLGPVMGFFIGSQCLKLWIDPSVTPNIDMKDPRWVGAWWLGFVILGTILSVLGSFFFMFPRQLPENLAGQVEKLEKKAFDKKDTTEQLDLSHYIELNRKQKQHDKPSIKKLPNALMRLARNPIWMGNSINAVLYLLALAGYWSFKPKYLETQFQKSASQANLITGMAGLVASMVGILVGGVVIHKKKPRARVVTAYNVFLSLAGAAAFFCLIYVGCDQVEVRGAPGSEYLSQCSKDCNCFSEYKPICSDDQITYYSACMAGCQEVVKNGTDTIYKNCKCLTSASDVSIIPLGGEDGRQVEYQLGGNARSGVCPTQCTTFTTYIVVETTIKMLGATGRVGGTLVYLRSVEEQDKALALGTLTVLMSLLAFIPGPVIMGAILDSACKIWEEKENGERGNCWLYDTDHLRVAMHIFPALMILLSTVGDIIVWKNSKRLKLYADADNIDSEEIQLETKEEKTEKTYM